MPPGTRIKKSNLCSPSQYLNLGLAYSGRLRRPSACSGRGLRKFEKDKLPGVVSAAAHVVKGIAISGPSCNCMQVLDADFECEGPGFTHYPAGPSVSCPKPERSQAILLFFCREGHIVPSTYSPKLQAYNPSPCQVRLREDGVSRRASIEAGW